MIAKPVMSILRIVVAIALPTIGGSAWAIEIDETLWGFDGKPQERSFVPLSVLVSNPAATPFEGSLDLIRRTGAGERVGMPIRQPLFLAPFSSRWVQFEPYVLDQWSEWSLAWNGGGYGLPRPAIEPTPAHVFLRNRGDLSIANVALKSFPVELFPTSVTATDGLASVTLDQTPKWEQARRQAFLDWLRLGGRVHVLQNDDGDYPDFTGGLAELDSPLDEHQVGAGLVVRHPRLRSSVDRKFVERVVLGRSLDPQAEADDSETVMYPGRNYGDWVSDDVLFGSLKRMTRADHNWGVIYLLAMFYVVLVFPGCYGLALMKVDYRMVFAALLGVVALFSVAFAWVGRRGYGESTTVNSVAIARPLEDGRLDVRQWSDVFVTSGDDYVIRHEGAGRAYSTAQELESVNGVIIGGADAQIVVDIPPFSSRTFTHRTMTEGGSPSPPTVERIDDGPGSPGFGIRFGEGFPVEDASMLAIHGGRFHRLHGVQADPHLRTTEYAGEPETALGIDEFDDHGFSGGPFWDHDEDVTVEVRYQRLFHRLIARDLGVRNSEELAKFSPPDDSLRLYVYAPLPKELRASNDRFPLQNGYVLYRFDLAIPEDP